MQLDIPKTLTSIADSFVFDEELIIAVAPNGAIAAHHPGFALGVAGIGYVIEMLLQSNLNFEKNQRDTLVEFSNNLSNGLPKYIQKTFSDFGSSAIAHGFCSGVAGTLLFEKIRFKRTNQKDFLINISQQVRDLYSNLDYRELNPSFYGGLSGLIFFLCHIVNLKLDENLNKTLKLTIQKSADTLASYNDSNGYVDILKGIIPYNPPIGFAWGTTGIAYGLGLSYLVLEDSKYKQAATEIFNFEDRWFEDMNATKDENNDHSKFFTNTFCYGRTGMLHPRLLLFPNDPKVLKLADETIKKGTESTSEDFSFCCGKSSLTDLFSETKKNENWNQQNIVFPSMDFLLGKTGYIYTHLNLETQLKHSIFKL